MPRSVQLLETERSYCPQLAYKSTVQRSSSIALGGLVLVALVVLLWKGGPRPAPVAERPSWSAALSASTRLPTLSLSPSSGWPSSSAPPLLSVERPPPPRPLPPGSPKNVRIGVVLFRYRGAELAPHDARSKAEALTLAKAVLELARKDFKAAVKQGDPGSHEDAGKIGRNILEPPVEYEIFTLAPGAVSDPIDTPRGYWVARRND
jgi:hypothetical protein